MISEEYWSSSAAIVGSPGGLVWVRRRNGSWWPGRIVPTDELAAKYASRSGTPIQLLGREDGSMDWYNLEKSKRVKPFRCGEYDECIEKVKDSEPRSSKSASNKGKYVRRDDAILHALKLEKALCFSGEQICSGTCNSLVTTGSTRIKKHNFQSLETQPGYRPNKHSVLEDNSTQEMSQSVVQFKQQSKLIAKSMRIMQKRKWRTPNDLEDDEGIKRMRDLQEIGTGRQSHRKRKMYVHSRWSHDPVVADRAHTESTHANGFNRIKSIRNSCSSVRNQSHVQVHEFVKRKDRRRALNKVCNGTRVIIPSYCHWDGTFSGRPSLQGTIETNPESTSEDTTESSKYSGTSSDEMFNVDGNTYEVNDSDFVSKANGLSNMLEFICDDCTRSTNDLVNIPLSMDESIDGDYPNTMEHRLSGKHQPQSAAIKKYHGRSRDGSISRYMEDLGESDFKCLGSYVHHVRQKTQMKALEQYSIAKKIHKHLKNAKKQAKSIGLDILYEVEVSVQRNTHGSHAPLVSLMSKLNGKAIIGHPVPVEFMEDGATDALFVRNGNQPARINTYQSSINGGEIIRRKGNVTHRYTNTEGPNYNHSSVTTSSKRKSSNNWKSGFSPRKIRRLSSFSADLKQEKKVEAEKIAESTVVCIPVRLVFSRITQALS